MTPAELQSLMERAERSLRSARNLLEDGDNDFAISRAYYAMFHAATAALLCRDVQRARHGGVIGAFGQYLVKSGPFTTDHQRALQGAFRERTEGDYSGVFPARESVEQRLKEAQWFVESVTVFLKAEGCLPSG